MKSIFNMILTAVAFAAPPYDVVSIQPAEPAHIVVESSRVTATGMTLKELIMDTRGLQTRQVSGGPDWLATQRFNMEANSAGASDSSQLGYARVARFRLSAHYETRELTRSAGRPVIGRSGLTGNFDLNPLASLTAKAAVEMIVIDHAEMPSAN